MSSTTSTPSAATRRRESASRPRRRSHRQARLPPTCSPARAGTRASSESSRRGSPSATTARPYCLRSARATRRRSARRARFQPSTCSPACGRRAVSSSPSAGTARRRDCRSSASGSMRSVPRSSHTPSVCSGPRSSSHANAPTRSWTRRTWASRWPRSSPRLGPFGLREPARLAAVSRRADRRRQRLRRRARGDHARFTLSSGAGRARAVAFGSGTRLGVEPGRPVDAAFALERHEWQGVVEPRLVLRALAPCAPEPVALVGEPADWLGVRARGARPRPGRGAAAGWSRARAQ